MNRVKISILACAVGVSVLSIVGCRHKEPVEAVGERAVERWDLLSKRQAIKAYEYLSPGYRSTHTVEQYVAFIATSRLQWKSAKVDSVKCEEDACTAKLVVTSMVPGIAINRPSDLELAAPVTEKWIQSDGQWFFLPDAKINPQGIAEEAAGAKAAAQEPGGAGQQENPAAHPAEGAKPEEKKQPD